MRTRLFVTICFLSLFLVAASDPFSGVWKLNLSEPKLPLPVPQSQTGTIESDSNGVRIREEVLTDKGERLKIAVDAKFDGKYYPISGSPYADEVAYQRVDSHIIKGIAKKAGKVVSTETVVISRDDKTMKATYQFLDSSGQQVDAVAVFDRE